MLIRSPRHTPQDLAAWAELEEADRAYVALPTLAKRVARSLTVLREFLLAGVCPVWSSHGKDSVVVWHLAWRLHQARELSGLIPCVRHLCPTNHNPDCDAVRDAMYRRFPLPYAEVSVDYGDLHARDLPQHELDRLTDERWYAAIESAGRPWGGRRVLGVRADESGGRKARMCVWGESSPNSCAPIGWWSTQDVFAYLALHALPVHPAYACLGVTTSGRCLWPRDRLRVAEIGDTHGRGNGRGEWERRYYLQSLNRLLAGKETACPR